VHTTDEATVTNKFTDGSPDGQPSQQQPRPRRQLHGRRMGRAMKASQSEALASALPAMRLDLDTPAPTPLNALFPVPVDDVWLEVGFGGGEHLFWQAENHPRVGFIGCEPFLTGVAKLLREAQKAGLSNLRVHDDDARQVLNWLPEASIGRVFVLFPDPWPKKRHRKRRFLHASELSSLARVMRPGARLRFATDIANYAEMVLQSMAGRTDFAPRPGRHAERPADWPATRYEAKAIKAGRPCQFFSFERL
jgi:tRNA (guanine-N7-)-methyltransferase